MSARLIEFVLFAEEYDDFATPLEGEVEIDKVEHEIADSVEDYILS
jgi:hypothetical protein